MYNQKKMLKKHLTILLILIVSKPSSQNRLTGAFKFVGSGIATVVGTYIGIVGCLGATILFQSCKKVFEVCVDAPYESAQRGWEELKGNLRRRRMLVGSSNCLNGEIVKQKVSDFINRISAGVMSSFLGFWKLSGEDKVFRMGEIKEKFDLMNFALEGD